MKTTRFVHKVAYMDGGEGGIIFCGTTDNDIPVRFYVSPELITQLADLIHKVGGHGGHAVWHYNNPDQPIPCSSCKPIV
jgi:hypothetical protein